MDFMLRCMKYISQALIHKKKATLWKTSKSPVVNPYDYLTTGGYTDAANAPVRG